MGFKPPRKLYKLKFADEEMNGLEVTMRSVSMGKILELQELSVTVGDDPQAKEVAAQFRTMMTIFADALVEWNVEDDDEQAVPADFGGVLTQDPGFVMAVIQAWIQAISGVDAPLPAGSNSGATFPEASLPMEPLSPSPENYGALVSS